MSWRTLRRALEWVSASSAPPRARVVFTGGEPLLAFPLIRQATDYIAARCPGGNPFQYVLQTNGLLLDDAVVDFLERHRFELRLSFDGLPEAQKLRSPDSFRRLDGLLHRMRVRHREFYNQNLIVGAVVTPETISRLVDTVGYFLDREIPRIALAPVMVTDSCGTPWLGELQNQFWRILEQSLEYVRQEGRVPLLFLRGGRSPSRVSQTSELMCGVTLGRTAVVDVDGGVYGCLMLNASNLAGVPPWLADDLRPLQIGHITDPDLPGRFNRFRTRANRSAILTTKSSKYSSLGACATCPAVAECFVCPASIGLQPGNDDPHRVPDFSCAWTRTAWETAQRFQAATNPAGHRPPWGNRGGPGIDLPADLSDQADVLEAMERVERFLRAQAGGDRVESGRSGSGI